MIRSLVLLFFLFECVFAGSGNDPPPATYHRAVSEVRVTFFATDENNHPVDSIGNEDFAIVDGDVVVRDFRSLTHSTETALDAVILLDASQSASPRFQSSVNDILRLVSQEKASRNDRLSLLSFAGLRSTVLCDHNCHSPAPEGKLLAIQAQGATPLFDALTYAANFVSLHRAAGVRPVLILFSDGKDTISRASSRDALRDVIASGAPLYAIDMNLPGMASRGSLALRQMADAAGGRYFSPRQSAADVLRLALEDLRASYVVTYRPPRPVIGFHSLRILPKHNLKLRFHCRGGYYYGDSVP